MILTKVIYYANQIIEYITYLFTSVSTQLNFCTTNMNEIEQ